MGNERGLAFPVLQVSTRVSVGRAVILASGTGGQIGLDAAYF